MRTQRIVLLKRRFSYKFSKKKILYSITERNHSLTKNWQSTEKSQSKLIFIGEKTQPFLVDDRQTYQYEK